MCVWDHPFNSKINIFMGHFNLRIQNQKKVEVLMDSVVNEKVLHAKQESRSLLEYLCVWDHIFDSKMDDLNLRYTE